jgi:lysophospholipase L1-like esterase
MHPSSFVAIGDSFTEGMGDHWPDGGERGWADLTAIGLGLAAERPIRYANLAIRGRKLGAVIDEQLDPAITMRPELISINGGGNDMLRPRIAVAVVADRLVAAAERAAAAGIRVLLLSGADPSGHIPMGAVVRRRGEDLTTAVRDRLDRLAGADIVLCDNFGDAVLREPGYWSGDGLHLNSRGHHRVAGNVLTAIGVVPPPEYEAIAAAALPDTDYRSSAYWRAHVLPWIGRRLTGRSSGDGRTPKRPHLEPL